jgi:hypothetical protein
MRQLISAVKRRLFRPSETIEGYEQPELVDVIFRKTLVYEPAGDWPEMHGATTVLDFGGGCGLHYKQARSQDVRWAVVETAAMVERAKELATDRLQFFTRISEAKDWLGYIDVMHSNGALHFSPDPERTLHELCGIGAKKMLWDRMFISHAAEKDVQVSFLSDNGPGPISIKEKIVRYERTAIQENSFLAAHANHYLTERGLDWFRFKLK